MKIRRALLTRASGKCSSVVLVPLLNTELLMFSSIFKKKKKKPKNKRLLCGLNPACVLKVLPAADSASDEHFHEEDLLELMGDPAGGPKTAVGSVYSARKHPTPAQSPPPTDRLANIFG